MKNKFFLNIIFFIIFAQNILSANQFKIESSEIKVLEKGNIIKASQGVKIISNDGVEITANELIYNKEKLILEIFGNVTIDDKINDIVSRGEKYIYYKNLEKITTSGKSNSIIKNKIFLDGEDIIYERNTFKMYSDKKTKIEDLNSNKFYAEKFKLNTSTSILKAKSLSLTDSTNNQYNLSFAVVDLKDKKFLGSNVYIDFEDSLFGNNQNNPRLKANSIISEDNETIVYKGSFTTCNQKDDKCPPWLLSANEVIHKKKEKKIEYKNAWLKIYDKPVLYFPYFFHPDPTVKRQSGFLMPTFKSSNNSGASLQIPYYKVISERKDLTFYPRLFFDNEILIQTEYRQANKNSDFFLDFSINKDESSTKNHFFADVSSTKENNILDFHLEKVSNDKYLKKNNIVSPILLDNSTLHSFINYNSYNESSSLDLTAEVFEDLSKPKTNRYEYIYPNFNYEKDLSYNNDLNGDLLFNSRGYQKNYESNIDETILINDLVFSSFGYADRAIDGLQNSYEFLVRNINSNSDNSEKIKEGGNQQLLSTIILESNLPLKKENEYYNNFLTPKFSLRFSPNATKNNSNLNKSITYDSIYSLDRIDDAAIEGGESFTYGLEYSAKNKEDKNIMSLSLANILRLEENPDLPKIQGVSEKRSDIIGDFEFFPSKFFDVNYQFSLDKDLKHSNYDLIKTNIKINNFVTSFEYLEEDNYLNEDSYITNNTKFNFDKNNSVGFETSKNLDQNITNYYNLIYEYENDCLIAAVEYNKNYYVDEDLQPEESLFFSIKIIPFGKINSPALTQ